MVKQGTGVQKCIDAFDRLKEGNATNQKFKSLSRKQITPSIVSQEAGLDAGYLKKSRVSHQPIISLINAFRMSEEPESMIRKRDYEKVKADNESLKLENERLIQQRDQALSRELLLIRKLSLFERELLELRSSIEQNVESFDKNRK